MTGGTTSPELPDWIPTPARSVYLSLTSNGRYNEYPSLQIHLDTFFKSPILSDFWRHLSSVSMSQSQLDVIVNYVISNLDLAPSAGHATRDRPDKKTAIRDAQKRADKLRLSAAAAARNLARQLESIKEMSYAGPLRAFSPVQLLRLGLEKTEQSDLSNRFDEFLERTPSRAVFWEFMSGAPANYGFSSTPELLKTLADELDSFPNVTAVFENDPQLSSTKSSYRDFVRGLHCALMDFENRFGIQIKLRQKDWSSLVKVFFNLDINHRHLSGILN